MKHGLAAMLIICVAASAFAEPPMSKPIDKNDPDYLRCKRISVTGSLVKKEKVCKTNAEWDRLDGNGNRAARAIMDMLGVCAGGSGCSGPS